MWRVMGSSTQESDPRVELLFRMPNPRADPSLNRSRKVTTKKLSKDKGSLTHQIIINQTSRRNKKILKSKQKKVSGNDLVVGSVNAFGLLKMKLKAEM